MRQTMTRAIVLIVLLALMTGCLGDSDGVSDVSEPSSSDDPPTDTKPPPVDEPETAEALDRYAFANGCYQLRAGDQYVSRPVNASGYGVTDQSAEAARFYMKPTSLGSYLLMSDYQRTEGEQGTKTLLGISDPAGEFLDASGRFVGEVSYLVAGLGDTSGLILDPVAPLGGLLRELGESLEDAGARLGDTTVRPELGVVEQASDLSVWDVNRRQGQTFQIVSRVTGLVLVAGENGLTLASPSVAPEPQSRFEMMPASDCASYPQADLNAEVDPEGPAIYMKEVERFRSVPGIDQDDVYGFVDAHSHISAYEFIGGRVNYGDPFHRFGVDHALDDCKVNHGPQGATGIIEQVTSTLGPHETQGWPTYDYWPRNDSLQHHQSYYRWIERAHLSGMKILVSHLVHNEILCQINPQKQNDCNAMPAIELQAKRMHQMEDYIDAQHGGPGEGWFRIVTSPAEARDVIGEGKMAVILGVEMSKVLDCGEFQDSPECSREEIVRRLDRLYEADVRSLFPVHKFDNAFGGHLPDLTPGVGIGPVLSGGNLLETGHAVEYEECPDMARNGDSTGDEYTGTEPDQNAAPLQPLGLMEQLLFQLDYLGDRFPQAPEGFAKYDPRVGTDHLCNRRGLTDLGHFLIDELMERGMMIETDHISRKAAARILEITDKLDYPIINSHGSWGGSQALRDRVAKQGGITASFGSTRGTWVDQLVRDGNRPRSSDLKVGPFGGAPFASDVNGIAQLAGNPGTAEDEAALYPFTSVDGRVTFDIQTTGDRSFSLYDGRGVAHYGLYPDQIADMMRFSDRSPEKIDEAVDQLFSSAEAYLRMWERVGVAPQ